MDSQFVKFVKNMALSMMCLLVAGVAGYAQTIATHDCTDPGDISSAAVQQAKSQFRIWYGHTSHGSQITSGMSVLMSDDPALYSYNNTGSGGALSYQEVYGDLGHDGDLSWESATRTQLNSSGNDRNMVVWSWCGGASDNTASGINTYLNAMNQLELDFPDVTFIYMTGHLDGTGEPGNLNQMNNLIRQYCQDHDKILFDFADIESYDPDNSYFLDLFANDNCDYTQGGESHNWALEWCAAHPGECSSVSCAHSQSLNCDRKGVAFWWLLAELADVNACVEAPTGLTAVGDSVNGTADLSWSSSEAVDSFQIQRLVQGGTWQQGYATVPGSQTAWQDTGLTEGQYSYRVLGHLNDGGDGSPCDSEPSQSASVTIASQIPEVPTGLQAAYSSPNVQLSWTDESNNEVGFGIQRNVDNHGFTTIGTVSANTTQFEDTAIVPLTDIVYRVFSYNSVGNSDFSQTASVSIPEETFVIRLETTEEVDDSFLDPDNPDTNYGSSSYVDEMFHFILKFNFPSILDQKTIISAKLAFYGWGQVNWQPGQYLDLYRVIAPWTEGAVTWNSPWVSAGGDYDGSGLLAQVPITENCDHCFYPEVDVTGMVTLWLEGCADNDGFMLVNDSVTHTSLKASEYSAGQRTYLEITYSNQTHISPHLFGQVCLTWCRPLLFQSAYDVDEDQLITILDLLLIQNGCNEAL